MSANFKAKQKDNESDLDDADEKTVEETSEKTFITKKKTVDFGEFENSIDTKSSTSNKKNALTDSYESMMNIFGRFKQETLELGLTAIE
jgi:hypothetical protein